MSNTTCAMPERRPSAAEILDTPLDELLTGLDVDLFDSTIPDRTFFGAVVRKGGQLYLTMPPNRSELEHDTVARYLIAQAFDVDLPDLPPPFITTAA